MKTLVLSLLILLIACTAKQPAKKEVEKETTYTVLISKAHKLRRYKKWLDAHSENLIIHHLYELSINIPCFISDNNSPVSLGITIIYKSPKDLFL